MDSEVWDRLLVPRAIGCILLKLHYGTSNYFKRIMNTVFQEHPEYIDFPINRSIEPDRPRPFRRSSTCLDYQTQTQTMLDYHRFEFFRVCLGF
jgi:hypothetical protein